MKDLTSLAAVTFSDGQQTCIRVFYQHGDLIKESCYGSRDGWYATHDDIVARDVREETPTPIAAVSNGRETRIYFLDKQGVLRQRVRVTGTAGEGQWNDVPDFPAKTPAPNSQLTAALSDNDADADISVYYQDLEGLIQELKLDGSDRKWYDGDESVAIDAKTGTSLSVVAGPKGQLRLFYQNTQHLIKERYSDWDREWGAGRIAHYQIAPLAPICVLAWNYDTSLEICAFSIGPQNKIVEMLYKRKGWERGFKSGSETIITQSEKLSALAAVRFENGSISVLYQPETRVIGLYNPTLSRRIPLGIPTTSLDPAVGSPAGAALSSIKVCTMKETDQSRDAARNPAFRNSSFMRAAMPIFRTKAELGLPVTTLWNRGQTLKVRFLGGTNYLQRKVEFYAKIWEQYANIRLQFVSGGDSEIRIAFTPGQGSWSYIGTDNLNISQNEPTMNFGWFDERTTDTEFSRTTLHEFGHALGCIHEHQNPAGNIPWNREAVYAYYARTDGWSPEQVDVNIFQKYDASTTQYTQFDQNSIMLYSIPRELTTNGFSVGWNTTLSPMDQWFIGQEYP